MPGASRDEVSGWLGDALKVRVTAPAEDGKANEAIEALLAGLLGLPIRQVRIVSGGSSPRKVVEVVGLSAEEARRRISAEVDG